jgi:hypothetical protein
MGNTTTSSTAAALLLLALLLALAPAPTRCQDAAVDNLAIDPAFEDGTTVLAPTTGYNSGGRRGRMVENRGFGGSGSMSGGGLGGSGSGIGAQSSFRGLRAAGQPGSGGGSAMDSRRSGFAAASRQLQQAGSAVDNIDADVGDSLAGTPNAFRVAGFGQGFGGDRFGGGGAPGGFRGRRARLLR